MAPVRRVLDMVLANHEPFPAWAIGPGLRFIASNKAAERVVPGLTDLPPEQLVDLWCAGENPADDQARARATFGAIHMLRNEQFHHPHPALHRLLTRAHLITSPRHLTGLWAPVALSRNLAVPRYSGGSAPSHRPQIRSEPARRGYEMCSSVVDQESLDCRAMAR